jgi:hypothetical protein
MKSSTWVIGDEFTTAGGAQRWRVTDVGTRVLVAVELTEKTDADASWLDGPPYAICEIVFDEDDQNGIEQVNRATPKADHG